MGLLEEMRQKGLETDVITYNAGIAFSACEKGKLPDEALELCENMQRKGLEPGMITYGTAISACEKGRQPVKALAAERPGARCDHVQRSHQCM